MNKYKKVILNKKVSGRFMCSMCHLNKNRHVQNKTQYHLWIYVAIVIAYINFKMCLEIIKLKFKIELVVEQRWEGRKKKGSRMGNSTKSLMSHCLQKDLSNYGKILKCVKLCGASMCVHYIIF